MSVQTAANPVEAEPRQSQVLAQLVAKENPGRSERSMCESIVRGVTIFEPGAHHSWVVLSLPE